MERQRTEKKEKVWLPILVVVMIWAMTFVGCGKEETNNNMYNNTYYYNYSTFDNASTVFMNATTTVFNNNSTAFGNNSTIVNAIIVVSPNGGETLTRGGNMSVSWSLTANQNYSLFFYLIPQGTITISGPTYYDPNAGGYSMGAYSPIVIETGGSWAITIPTDVDASAPYKLKMYMNKAGSGGIFNSSDILASDESDAEFTIQ